MGAVACEASSYMGQETGEQGNGAVERSRTSDLLITNQLLYQLSYNGRKKSVPQRERRGA